MRRFGLLLLLAVVALAFASCGGNSKPAVHRSLSTVHAGDQTAMGSVHPPGWGHPPPGQRYPTAVRPSLSGTAEQFDTTTIDTVPSGARYLAGYTAGYWPTFFLLVRLSWRPHVVSIAISAGYHAQCLDIEPGDATPSQAASWYWAVKNDPGMRSSLVDGLPCEYSSYWEFVTQVRPVLAAAHIARTSVWEWDADYVFYARLDSGFDCTQWTDKALGRNLDESTCTLDFLGVRKPPPPPPPDPLHYRILTPTELQWVLRYDGARQHAKYDAYRRDVLQPELAKLAHAIWVVAHARGQGGWTIRNRGERFQLVYRRSLGQKLA